MSTSERIIVATERFAESVQEKTAALAAGEPEEQLRAPAEALLAELGELLGRKTVLKGESRLDDRLGRPDFAVLADGLLAGYVELKAPGRGACVERFTGHDKGQWERFRALPNLLYTDGNEWALYRGGERQGSVLRTGGEVTAVGKAAVDNAFASSLADLWREFLGWEPTIPSKPRNLAELLAPLCRLLRDDVVDALAAGHPAMTALATDWRQLLFPRADDGHVADSYAQTVTFALLLARGEGADTTDLASAVAALRSDHSLLSRSLQVLVDPALDADISSALPLLQRVIARIPATTMKDPENDPWLYFYEDFLAAYDPELRKNAGAYYTPVEVVHAQVRLADALLVKYFDCPLGFASGGVDVLDPAMGTGTYLLGILEHGMGRVRDDEGPGAVPARATLLARVLHGFEIMVGPRAVADLRLTQALAAHHARVQEGPRIFLTNTLESPFAQPAVLPLFVKEIAREHHEALQVKDRQPIQVCIGNPPYDRHDAATEANRAWTGGWVRHGGDGTDRPILDDFIEPVRQAGKGGSLKNAYNLYVYFWRWSLWKVFEHITSSRRGIVSFISASSYLDGDAFLGMRQHLRQICDDIWIIDLGGEGRGTRRDENVFDIQTPVAIGIAARYGKADKKTPARVHYCRLEGDRAAKLKRLDRATDVSSLPWQDCPSDWQDPFRPAGEGRFFDWPALTDLMPWQQSGVKAGRTWCISPCKELLARRWRTLLAAKPGERATLFKESPTGMQMQSTPKQLPSSPEHLPALATLPTDTPVPQAVRYGYRSFDRQYILMDGRLIDRAGPPMWATASEHQVYMQSLFSQPLDVGPALTVSPYVPDLDCFRGSYGAKAIFPLYRDVDGTRPNLLPGLTALLAETYGAPVSAEDVAGYLMAVLAQPAYTARFQTELGNRDLRVPLTREAALFAEGVALGRRLLWLHTWGERCVPEGVAAGLGGLPRGTARCVAAVSHEPAGYPESFSYDEDGVLTVGTGRFAPVSSEVWNFSVSGLRVVESWLGYRMKRRKGRTSSPLDRLHPEAWTPEFTSELLALLWILEATVAQYPAQADWLDRVLDGGLLAADELPPADPRMAEAPKVNGNGGNGPELTIH